jgi:DNA repair protein RadC
MKISAGSIANGLACDVPSQIDWRLPKNFYEFGLWREVTNMQTQKTDNHKENWRHPGGKLLRAGPEALSEAELLAIVISAGTAKNPAEKIAAELIEKFHSLRGIASQPLEELTRIAGLGQVKLCRIAAALEIGRRFANETSKQTNPSPEANG